MNLLSYHHQCVSPPVAREGRARRGEGEMGIVRRTPVRELASAPAGKALTAWCGQEISFPGKVILTFFWDGSLERESAPAFTFLGVYYYCYYPKYCHRHFIARREHRLHGKRVKAGLLKGKESAPPGLASLKVWFLIWERLPQEHVGGAGRNNSFAACY